MTSTELPPAPEALFPIFRCISAYPVGVVGRDSIDGWLGKYLRTRLGSDLARIVFRSGRIAAVYGAALSDGRPVVVKVHRRPVDLAYPSAATTCQRGLAEAGYRRPTPLDGPSSSDGLTATIETLFTYGEPGNAFGSEGDQPSESIHW